MIFARTWTLLSQKKLSEQALTCKKRYGEYTGFIMKAKVTMSDIFGNPHYRGKHVILAAGRVYTAKTGEGAAAILRKIRTSQPGVTPEVAYLPKAHSLILWM